MKFRTLAIIFTLLASASVSKSEIIGQGANDGSGSTDCTVIWQTSAQRPGAPINNTMFIVGSQFWAPGHILGSFNTNTADDPTVKVSNSIYNDTGSTWTGYHVDVSMDRIFSISDALASTPGNWIPSITQQPVPVGSVWVGQLDFSAGTPVADGDTLEFSYKITFGGSTHYNYDQDMTPVPEPGSIAVLVGGLLGLLIIRRRFA